MTNPVIEMREISKSFGATRALKMANICVRPGEVHAIVGENGAGKTTLMRILIGLEQPDSGTIRVRGREIRALNPMAAARLGIGMVHQHFMLVPSMTVAENLVLHEPPMHGIRFDRKRAESIATELMEQYGLSIDPRMRIRDCPIGIQQQVEILRALYRGAEYLILDEPTSVLTPQDSKKLLGIVSTLAQLGKSVILITHKLEEVMSVADSITVMRKGETLATVKAEDVDVETLAVMMTGKHLEAVQVPSSSIAGRPVLTLSDVRYVDERGVERLKSVSLTVKSGEIVGVAGIQGNGQAELADIIAGLLLPSSGSIVLSQEDVTKAPVAMRRRLGLAYIPEDRLHTGVCATGSVEETLMMPFRSSPPISRGLFIDKRAARRLAEDLLRKYDVRPADPLLPTFSLSGGNMQKVVVAREVASNPSVLVAFQPTWGLDVAATNFIHQELMRLRNNGVGVLLISLDLTEVLTLSDRVLVIYKGEFLGEMDRTQADQDRIGLLMAGVRQPMERE